MVNHNNILIGRKLPIIFLLAAQAHQSNESVNKGSAVYSQKAVLIVQLQMLQTVVI